MKTAWIFFVALRYFRTKKKRKRVTVSLLSTLGIGIGVMALVTVMGVMNGFQIGFIEDIINISSYHLMVKPPNPWGDAEVENLLKSRKDLVAVVPLNDHETILAGSFANPETISLRGLNPGVEREDASLINQLEIREGSFDLSRPGNIIIGTQMALALTVSIGDTLGVYSLNLGGPRGIAMEIRDFTVSGIFDSGYYQFDRALGFISLEDAESLSPASFNLSYGIKIQNRYRDRRVLKELKEVLPEGWEVLSWRDYNRSFFSALRMEKLMLIVFLGLIFIVVGVNIRHFLRREIVERKEEIGILRSLGASPETIRAIFSLEGFIIGIFGALGGLVFGLLITMNINPIFQFTENAVNLVLYFASTVFSGMSGVTEQFSIFSPAYFYIKEIPATLLPLEVIGTVFFAVFVSTLAAYSASAAVSSIAPARVLRGIDI